MIETENPADRLKTLSNAAKQASPETLADKLKSWTRWLTVLGAIGPILLQGMTHQIGWLEALIASLGTLLVGLGLISIKDIARIKAATELVRIEAAAKVASQSQATEDIMRPNP